MKPDLCEDIDMDRLNLSFKRNFGFLLRKFYSVDIEIFILILIRIVRHFMLLKFGWTEISVPEILKLYQFRIILLLKIF